MTTANYTIEKEVGFMSNSYSAGQLVRISPMVIPDTAKDDELLGELGVPGLFRHVILEIVSTSTDQVRGEIATCRITNPEIFKQVIPGVKDVKYEGELVVLLKEIVPANMKVTLDYILETSKTKDEILHDLKEKRKKMKNSGLDKRHKEMRANWKEIQILEGNESGPMPAAMGKVSVYLPKQKVRFDLKPEEVPGTDEESIKKFKQLLSNKLRGVRGLRKTNIVETKTVFGSVKVQKQGGVYITEGSLYKAYEEMMRTTLETDKKPTDAKANYVGIEIEFIFSGNYDALKKLLIEKKLHRHVCLKNDGSLRACHNAGSYAAKELNLICKTTEVEDVMQRLDSVLSDPVIDGYANRSCGLHVHLDVRNRDAGLVYKNLVRIQNILRGSQPVGRIKNTHCQPNTSDVLSSREDGNRYLVVNGNAYARHKTIEVRIHEGTTNCEDIFNWVSFLNSIADYKKEIPKNDLKKAEEIVAKFDINIPLHAIDYVDRRIEQFKSLKVVS
jgi:hypothetical protein